MARWTDEQIHEGLAHEAPFVRKAVLSSLSGRYAPDAGAAKAAMRAIGKYGRSAFEFPGSLCMLTLDAEGVDWILAELKSTVHRASEGEYFLALSEWVCNADIELLVPRGKDILAAPRFSASFRDPLETLLEGAELTNEVLWDELQGIAHDHVEEYDEENDKVGRRYCSILASRGWPGAELLLPLLPKDFEDVVPLPYEYWIGLFVIDLVGRRRLQEAIPALVHCMAMDAEMFLKEDAERALVRIGGDAVVNALAAVREPENDKFAVDALLICTKIGTPRSLEWLLGLPYDPEDGYQREFLDFALASQFANEANDRLAESVRTGAGSRHAVTSLIPVATLMGETYPELPAWRAKLESEEAEQQRILREWREQQLRMPAAPVRNMEPKYAANTILKEKTAGRNDPCPCGSGKKYKKCCLNK